MSARRKILFIIPSLFGGGAERILVNLLEDLDARRFEIHLLSVAATGTYINQVPQHIRLITLVRHNILARLLNYVHVKYDINRVYKWLVRRKVKDSYDVGISFLDGSYTDILMFLEDRLSKKVSWVQGGYKSNSNFSRFLTAAYCKRVHERRYSRLDTIVFASEDARAEFIEMLGRYPHMPVIFNHVGAARVREQAREPLPVPFNNQCINIVAVANLLPVKRHDLLIKSAYHLKGDGLAFKIRILGDGFMRTTLEELIDKYDVADHVDLLGFQSNPYPWIAASDVFVLTSESEARPMAVCEAMLLGKPLVVTECSGAREVVGYGQYGMVVGINETEVYTGLRRMILSGSLRREYAERSERGASLIDDKAIVHAVERLLGWH